MQVVYVCVVCVCVVAAAKMSAVWWEQCCAGHLLCEELGRGERQGCYSLKQGVR